MDRKILIKKVALRLSGKGFDIQTLKKHRVNLTEEERAKVKKLKGEWDSDKRSAIMKSMINGKPYYVTYTHRAFNYSPKLEIACKMFNDFIKDTA